MKHLQEITNRLKIKYFFSIIYIFPFISAAQLCNGSLGDAIVNINFGAGSSTFGSSLGALTSYGYVSQSFPSDGYYTVENTTKDAGSVWWSTTDHTGDAGGYMMVVNASLSKTDYFYKNTVTGLCGGTTYEFAAWIMNLLRSQDKSPPDITFVIETTDGTILNTYSTGSIPLASQATWKQFGFYFTTPQNVSSVVIRMRNNSAGGAPANDLALDDITFRACGATMKATVNGSSVSNYTICAGESASFSLVGEMSAGYSSPQLQWQVNTGSGWQDVESASTLSTQVILQNALPGIYDYRLAVAEAVNFLSAQCRVYSNLIHITVQENPKAAYTEKSEIACASQPVYFQNTTVYSGELNYVWSFGDGSASTEENPSHIYSSTGTYTTSLFITTAYGCKDNFSLSEPIVVYTIPTASFAVTPADTSIYYPHVMLLDYSSNATSCSISWGDETTTDCDTYRHIYSAAGTFTVTQKVTNTLGCSDVYEQLVLIRDEFSVFLPNAFSPNGDGLNDIFLPVVNAVSQYSFRVFDRWGKEIFKTNDPAAGWDGYLNGVLCEKGIYAYKISLKDDVGEESHDYTGKILLYLPEFITQY